MHRVPDEYDRLRLEERVSRFDLRETVTLEHCLFPEQERITLREEGKGDWSSALSEAVAQLLDRITRSIKKSVRLEALETQVRLLSARIEEMGRRYLAFPSIVSTPGVCGGSPRLIRTRIPIWILEQMRQKGFSYSKILESYPTLTEVDLAQAWEYVATHREQINKEIEENEKY